MTTRRRVLLGLAALCASHARAQAPQHTGKQVRVGIFETATAESGKAFEKVFVDSMRDLGWVEGRNIAYDRVYAGDDLGRMPELAAALVGRSPSVVYSITGEPAAAVLARTSTIPIVNGSISDITARGWAKSLSHPGGNVTGVVNIG